MITEKLQIASFTFIGKLISETFKTQQNALLLA